MEVCNYLPNILGHSSVYTSDVGLETESSRVHFRKKDQLLWTREVSEGFITVSVTGCHQMSPPLDCQSQGIFQEPLFNEHQCPPAVGGGGRSDAL